MGKLTGHKARGGQQKRVKFLEKKARKNSKQWGEKTPEAN